MSGTRTPIFKEGGTYGVSVWRLRKDEVSSVLQNNMFAALSDDEEENNVPAEQQGASSSSSGFHRPA